MTHDAICYVRCSSTEQVESGLGLADQEARCRAYAQMRGLAVVEVVADPGVSGARALETRPGGRRVLALTSGRRPAVRHVIALKLDRCFRSAADALAVTAGWNKRNVTLHMVDFGGSSLDLSSATGRMFLTVAAGFAELERGLCAERTRAALAVKRGRGEYTGGAPPFGYRAVRGKLVEDQEEQEVLALICELRGEGLSFNAIAGALNAREAPNRGAATWRKERVFRLWRRGMQAA